MVTNGKAAPPLGKKAPHWASEAEQAGKNLISEFQRIENAWKKAEDLLALVHVPVDVRVQIDAGESGSPDQADGSFIAYLGYNKLKDGWRICWNLDSMSYVTGETEIICRPVVECPLEFRLGAFEHFPMLYAEVIKTARAYVPKISKAVKDFEDTLEIIDL